MSIKANLVVLSKSFFNDPEDIEFQDRRRLNVINLNIVNRIINKLKC